MRLKGILLTLVVVLALVFAVMNWQALITPLPINIFLLPFEVPLGLILLLAAIGLCVLFFILAFLDRLGQLNTIVGLERELNSLRSKLEVRRLEELEGLETTLGEQLSNVESRVAEAVNKLETSTREALASFDTHTNEHLNKLEERVLLVRNELAADVAEAEDALRRKIVGEDQDAEAL